MKFSYYFSHKFRKWNKNIIIDLKNARSTIKYFFKKNQRFHKVLLILQENLICFTLLLFKVLKSGFFTPFFLPAMDYI
jgi:hypothetical protein